MTVVALIGIPGPADSSEHDYAHPIHADIVRGLIFVPCEIQAARDTTGWLILDTGTGYVCLDRAVAARMGIPDSSSGKGVTLSPGSIQRLVLGHHELQNVQPVALADLEAVAQNTGRRAIGLLGERALIGRVIVIDYADSQVVILPSPPDTITFSENARTNSAAEAKASADVGLLNRSRDVMGPLLSREAIPVPVRLGGDGKVLLTMMVSGAPAPAGGEGTALTLVLDTGAMETVLFEPEISRRIPGAQAWKVIASASAPTLRGALDATVKVAPRMTTQRAPGSRTSAHAMNVSVAMVETDLGQVIAAAVGEPVHGLLGYSFLKRYRVGLDVGRGVLWLDPLDGNAMAGSRSR